MAKVGELGIFVSVRTIKFQKSRDCNIGIKEERQLMAQTMDSTYRNTLKTPMNFFKVPNHLLGKENLKN